MKLAYPASHIQNTLSSSQQALKISRHSPCSACNVCSGFRPPPSVEVVLDEPTNDSTLSGLDQYGSDDEDSHLPYLSECACGHEVSRHGADEFEIGPAEFARRSRVAIRLDELLQDVGKLLDFEYADDDITSLRRQMRLPVSLVGPSHSAPSSGHAKVIPMSPTSSVLSDLPQPPTKKRRISMSSLSTAEDVEDEDEEDEEDKPRVSLPAIKAPDSPFELSPTKQNGKQPPGQPFVPSIPAPSTSAGYTALLNGINGRESKVKVEDVMDESQLSRLAVGVTVDTGVTGRPSTGLPIKTEKAATIELRKGVIQITPVENDKQPRSLVILTGLKTLFQKQLPNMPREYIARLVYDANSKALAIVKRGYKVVGGICYRPFPHRGFAEIVFFATASVDQEKGYGGMLMDHFKAHIKKTYPDMMHFLTYADNYAVGYFEKQGFSKEITLDRSIWAAYIKDYEGGTIMQCTMLRKVDYLDKTNILAQQQDAVLSKIRQMSRSHLVYPGLPQFMAGGESVMIDPREVPGLRESGWLTMRLNEVARPQKNADKQRMAFILDKLVNHPRSWPFLNPVDATEVPDYYDVIKNPMDFHTMEHKLDTNQYKTFEAFVDDVQLVFDNCHRFNAEDSIWCRNAAQLEKLFREDLLERVKRD